MMRAYLRTSRRTGVSMPLWLAVPFYLLYASAVIVVALAFAVGWLALHAWLMGEAAWRRRHP